MKRAGKILLVVVAVLVIAQVFQCERTNPPVTGDLAAPADVEAVLRRSCYDCHSNETVWPWYAHVAPMSWLLHRDVIEGRRHVNFSEWNKVPAEKLAKRKSGIWREIESGDMPLWFYLPLHPTAKLSDADKALIEKWAGVADQH